MLTERVVPELFTVDEAAEFLRVTPKSVRHMIERCQIPVVRIGGRVRIPVTGLRKRLGLLDPARPNGSASKG
jgi:excisionase family DNA binding protein